MMTDALLKVAHAPLTAIALTLAAFAFALWLYRRTGWLVLQPVLITMLLIIAGIRLLQLDYAAYRDAVVPIAWLLGPTTVALAVPLYRNLRRIRGQSRFGRVVECAVRCRQRELENDTVAI